MKISAFSAIPTLALLVYPPLLYADNRGPKTTQNGTIYIPITKDLAADAKAKIIEMGGSCTVDANKVTSEIKSRIKSDVTPERVNQIVRDQLEIARTIIEAYNNEVKSIGDKAAEKVEEAINESAPSLKVVNQYIYYEKEKDPGDPGWQTSTLSIEGTKSIEPSFTADAKVTITIEASVLLASVTASFDVVANCTANCSFVLKGETPTPPDPVNKPTTETGGTWILEKSWGVEAGAGAATQLKLGVASSSDDTQPELTGTMTAGSNPPPP